MATCNAQGCSEASRASCNCIEGGIKLCYEHLDAHFQSSLTAVHIANILSSHISEAKSIFNKKVEELRAMKAPETNYPPESIKKAKLIKNHWFSLLSKINLYQGSDEPNSETTTDCKSEEVSQISPLIQNPKWIGEENGIPNFDKNEDGAPRFLKNEKIKTNAYFQLEFPTQYGEVVLAVGNVKKLGNWDPNRGFHLGWTNGNIWKGIVLLNDSKHSILNYKFVIKKDDWFIWQDSPEWNNILQSRLEDCNIEFNLHYQTKYGETLCVSGNHEKLGNWDPNRALKLKWNDGGLWSNSISMRKEDLQWIEYKYLLKKWDENIWEYGSNRKINCSEIGVSKKIFDWWQVEKKNFIDFVLSGLSRLLPWDRLIINK